MTSRTLLPSWQALTKHAEVAKLTHIKTLFADNEHRFSDFSIQLPTMLIDFSKNLISKETLHELIALATDCDIEIWREKLFAGAAINKTENRPVLHTALRDFGKKSTYVNGEDITEKIHESLAKIEVFTEQIRSGVWKGHSGKAITDVVNIGVGGSNLGPQMVTEALKHCSDDRVSVHYVSNVDGTQISNVLASLTPDTVLIIISSKTFTTTETIVNAETAIKWLTDNTLDQKIIEKQVVAVTANKENALKFGINNKNIFEMWDWVGGRFSLWSAIGLPIALSLGFNHFKELLEGAFELDQHFCNTPLENNAPVILALISVWNCTFLGAQSQAILPYDQPLHMLSAYLQQAEMESNGKSVSWHGDEIYYPTVPSIWGTLGINGQHAFYQYLHQSNNIVPADFIGSINNEASLTKHHEILLANLFAQTRALMMGVNEQQVRDDMEEKGHEESYINSVAPHKVHNGNRPTNTILLDSISPRSIGSLIALYEHKVFVQGQIWGVNSFDQWGVELGKQLGHKVHDALQACETVENNFDSSTQGLIDAFRAMKDKL